MTPSSPSPFSIRDGHPRDLRAAAALFVDVFRAPPYGEDWSRPVARAYLADLARSPRAIVLVAELPGGDLAGFVAGVRHGIVRAVVHEIAVAEPVRGRGIGSALLAEFEERAAAAGVRAVELLTRRGFPAARFYENHGYRMCREMDLMMRRFALPRRATS